MFTSFDQFYFLGRVPLTSADPIHMFNMNKEYIENLRASNFLYWLPNYNLGINISGWDPALNPFNLPNFISAILGSNTINVYIFSRQLTMALMGFFAFILLRYLGFSHILAFLGGLIYMFNPMTDEHHYMGIWTYAYIFTPIGIIFIHEWLKRNRRIFLIFFWGLLSGLLYLTGGMSALQYVFLGISLYAVMLIFTNQSGVKQFFSVLGFLATSGLIALLVGGYIFIPEADIFIFKEIRPKYIDTAFLYLPHFSLMEFIRGLLSFVFPYSISMFTTNYGYGFTNTRIEIVIGNFWNYLNILILPCILVLLTNWKKISRMVRGLLIFVLLYYGFFLNPTIINPDFILKIFPFYTFTKNFPIYYIGLTILIITTIDSLIAGRLKFNKMLHNFVNFFSFSYFILAVLFLGLVIMSRFQFFTKILILIHKKFGNLYGGRFSNVLLLRLLTDYTFHSLTSLFIFILLCVRGMQIFIIKNFSRKYFLAGLIILTAIEYACFTRIYYPFMDKDTLDFYSSKIEENRFILNLKGGTRIAYQRAQLLSQEKYKYEYDKNLFYLPISELKRISQENYKYDYLYNYAIPFPAHLSLFGVYNITMDKNFLAYYSRMAKGNPLYEQGVKNKEAYVYAYLYNINESSPLTRPIYTYLVTQNEVMDMHLTKVLSGKYYNIYKNDLALPRAYFVTQTIYEPDISKGLDILEGKSFDWKNQVVVHNKELSLSPRFSEANQYSLKKLKIFYNDVEIKIENNKKGVLVLNDLFYPYWKAFDNGRPTELFRVNGIFRGVKLESGKHIIKMHFHNPKLTMGIWVSLISTMSCIIATIYLYNKKRAIC